MAPRKGPPRSTISDAVTMIAAVSAAFNRSESQK
jgi:hypothetical protein